MNVANTRLGGRAAVCGALLCGLALALLLRDGVRKPKEAKPSTMTWSLTANVAGHSLRVHLEDMGGDALANQWLWVFSEREPRWPLAFGKTDREGLVAFAGLEQGLYRVRVSGTSVTSSERRLVSVPGESNTLVLRALRRRDVRGVVRNAKGVPVASKLQLVTSEGSRTVQVGDDGQFLLEDVEVRFGRLWARRGNECTTERLSGGTFLNLRLSSCGEVFGRVDVQGGRPAASAEVVVLHESGWAERGETDQQGRFALHGLPLGSWQLSVRKPGFVFESVSLQLEGTERVRLGVELEKGMRLSGLVQAEGGQAVSGVRLMLEGESESGAKVVRGLSSSSQHKLLPVGELGVTVGALPVLSADGLNVLPLKSKVALLEEPVRTGGDGAFSFSGIPRGSYRVIAMHSDYMQSQVVAQVNGASARVNVTLTMQKAEPLRGEVVADSSSALVGYVLAFARDRAVGTAVLDETGAFELPHASVATEVRVHATGYLPAIAQRSTSDSRFLRIQMTKLAVEWKGQVKNGNGEAVSGALATLQHQGRPVSSVRSDGQGMITILVPDGGEFVLRVTHEDYLDKRMQLTPSNPGIVLESGQEFVVTVRDAWTGAKVEGASISLRDHAGKLHVKRDNPAVFSGVVRGSAVVSVTATTYSLWRQNFVVGAEQGDLDVHLEPAAVLAGVVYSEAGRRAAGATVRVFDLSTKTDKDGRFHLDGFPLGDVTVVAEHGSATGILDVSLRPGEEYLSAEILLESATTE